MHRVLIVGGGFGGFNAARHLRKAPVAVTLVDRHNHHLFQPLLYQVATGALSPANIASPLRHLLRRQQNTEVLLAQVTGFDVAQRTVLTNRGPLRYDSLILAAGSSHSYFGNNEWASLAPGLKTLDDATAIRRRLLLAFEQAETAGDAAEVHARLTFVIVGGGPTGVEMAGAVAEIANDSLRNEFRHINPRDARILLLENSPRILQVYEEKLSRTAERGLAELGVTVMTGARVTRVEPQQVVFERNGQEEFIRTSNVIWAAGVEASPLGRALASATGAELDRAGRIIVERDCSIPAHSGIFAIGDMAHYAHTPDGQPLPALAPVALQQGEYVARVICRRVEGKESPAPFRYRDYGTMATIGRGRAIADIRGWKLTGALAWFAWLFIHLMQIVAFQNRVLILIQWAWHYFTLNRAARLITGKVAPEELVPVKYQHIDSCPH